MRCHRLSATEIKNILLTLDSHSVTLEGQALLSGVELNVAATGITFGVFSKSSASFVFIFGDLFPISLFYNKVIGYMIPE